MTDGNTADTDFNPRTPWGVRLPSGKRRKEAKLFQSTHPVGGATMCTRLGNGCKRISIHAPRGGCDSLQYALTRAALDFNPRTPHGVRLQFR